MPHSRICGSLNEILKPKLSEGLLFSLINAFVFFDHNAKTSTLIVLACQPILLKVRSDPKCSSTNIGGGSSIYAQKATAVGQSN